MGQYQQHTRLDLNARPKTRVLNLCTKTSYLPGFWYIHEMVDLELVTQLCLRATAGTEGAVVDVVRDPLDEAVWVRMTSWTRAGEATSALMAYGLAVVDRRECRLQVTGWDVRALRRRLGALVAGVDDLRVEWDATAELARYHRDRRAVVTGDDPEYLDVLADVERTLREARPMPHTASGSDDVETLLQLVDAAEDAYSQLITEHVDHAASVLIDDANRHRPTETTW